MSELLWDDAKSRFDPNLMGELPDVCVADTTVEDWQVVFDLVRASGWEWEYREGDDSVPLPSAADVLSRPDDAALANLHVWPAPDVLAIFRPWSATEIEFDVDLRELQSQAGVDLLCDLLETIGRSLNKAVTMSPETDWGTPVLGFDPAADRVVLLVDPAE